MVKRNAHDSNTTDCTLKHPYLQILRGRDGHDGLPGSECVKGDKGDCGKQGPTGPKNGQYYYTCCVDIVNRLGFTLPTIMSMK